MASPYDQPPPSKQPVARPAGSTGKVTVTSNPRLGLRGGRPINRVTVTHAAKGPSADDLIFGQETQAIGPDVLAKAANPRVATLQDVLGGITGIPALTNAVRTHNSLAAAGNLAALFPFGRAGRAIKAGVDVAKAIEEAPKVEKAAEAVAKAPKVSYTTKGVERVVRGKATVATGGEPGQQVREGLRGAKSARTAQDILYSHERSKRAALAAKAMDEFGGQAGYDAALRQLKGELPKLSFGGFENFDQNGLDALFTHIQQHPSLRPYDKIRSQTALLNVLNGKVPTKSELSLLEQSFGKEVSSRIAGSVPTLAKLKNLGAELWNLPRSLMASFDLSAPFRQGLVAGTRHPVMFFRNFAPMVKAFGSENVYHGIMEEIYKRPNFPKMQESGLALTDLGPLQQREEQFFSNLAERIPVAGRGVRASGRAYTGFLNKMRADMFDYLVQSAQTQGLNTNDGKLVKSIAKYVNSATGRGDLGMFQKHAVSLNSAFFSPRLLASRLNFMNPVYYASLDPFARKEALRAALSLVSTIGATAYLAKLAGAKVNSDPRNADFAKIRIGSTRIDIAGGFQQPVRLLAQLASGKIISSTTGDTLRLGPEGPGKLSRRDILQRFLEQKLAPTPGAIDAWFKGTDFADKPFSWKRQALQSMIPLLAQDADDIYNQYGSIPFALGGYGLGAFGIGLQTYSQKPPKARPRSGNAYNLAPLSGGASPYDQSPVGGGSPYAQAVNP